jgi:acetyl-CoA/propionyl-CoA carboxylase carboxyl transferase subunit
VTVAEAAPGLPPGIGRDPVGRLEAFFDRGSLLLRPRPDDAGVECATGLVGGSPAVAFASDPSVQGGALGRAGCAAIVAGYDAALAQQVPIVGLWHSGGARLGEGVASLDGVGMVFAAMTRASGRVPQLSVVLGPAAGGAAYGPALTDLVVLGPAGRVFVTGPGVVRSVTGEEVDDLRLGGPEPHGRRSGVVHVVTASDHDAIDRARELTALLAAPGRADGAGGPGFDRPFGALLPDRAARAYDVHPVLDTLLDRPGVELQPRWSPNLVTILGRFAGRTVGVVANNPIRLGGCLDASSAEKAARFVRMCDAFGVPLLVVVDVPGYLPGVGQEWDGVVRRGAKLLHAFAEATVPRLTLVTRKAYGGAYLAMNSRALGATAVLAWPGAEVAVMGAVAAVRVLHRRRLAGVPEHQRAALETELAAAHAQQAGGLDHALELGVVDEVIHPDETRGRLAALLAGAEAALPPESHRRRHGNIPL